MSFAPGNAAYICAECGAQFPLRRAQQVRLRCPECPPPGGELVSLREARGVVPFFPDGRFVLTNLVGRTMLSEVWGGWEPGRDRRVVVKFPLTEDRDDLERFRREARVQSALKHPNIPEVYGACTEAGSPPGLWIALQFIEGRGLDVVAEASRSEPFHRRASRLLGALAQVARALDYLHARGIWHRDVKPENVLVAQDGRAWLIDYGLARSGASASVTGEFQVVGTMNFMSPEQTTGRKELVDHRSDLWALGAVLYAALTGQYPFTGRTFSEFARAVQTTAPVPPRELAPEIPEVLERFILRALSRRRDERWPSAAEMATMMDEMRRGLGA